ncbi:MAG TPA: zinc-dependent peptidase [Bacteroidia bacterium]|jgi:hypothetical protein|nr:zinc-dependent peptidase [Bacteroidia bacterium]
MSFLPILLIVLVLVIRFAGKDIWQKLAYQTPLRKRFISEEDRVEMRLYLKSNTYYNNLSPLGKKKFEDRLTVFMLSKEFIGRSRLYVTEEMRVSISASAIQLTFGLNDYKLESLETIYIHPDIFQLGIRSPEFKGATTGHIMHLSWKSFKEGNQISDDNLNLGLHEMTHALKLTLYLGSRFDEVFAGRMEYWENLLHEQYKSFQAKPSFLRAYSKANTEEFFAVCVEAFFESPEKFRKELPEIYQSLVFLLNQDVLNKSQDYKILDGYFTGNSYRIPHPENVKTSYKYSNSHWSVSLMVFGVFCFIPTVAIAYFNFMCPAGVYFFMAFCIGTIGLYQKRYFFERKIFSGVYFLLYSYFGFGMGITTILLWLNFLIPASRTYELKANENSSDFALKLEYSRFFDNEKYHGKNPEPFRYHYGILGIRKVE